MTESYSPEVMELAQAMADYAQQKKRSLPLEQQILIDALRAAEMIRENRLPARTMVSQLRADATRYRYAGNVMLVTYFETLADRIDGRQPLNH